MSIKDRLLECLAGSSSKNPVDIEKLRKVGGDELVPILKNLLASHIVNHVNGFREGKPFDCYWLTGVVHPAQPFTFSPTSPGRPLQTSAPSISQPSQPEKSMPAESTNLNNIIEYLTENPGAKRSDLIEKLTKADGSNRQQILACISNALYNHHLRKTRVDGEEILFLDRAAKSATKKTDKRKPVSSKPAGKAAPKKAARKIVVHKGNHHPPAGPANSNFDPLKYGFNLGGNFSISKNGQNILLTPAEAMDLMQLGAQQIAMIEQL